MASVYLGYTSKINNNGQIPDVRQHFAINTEIYKIDSRYFKGK